MNGKIGELKTRGHIDAIGLIRQMAVTTRDERVRLQCLQLLTKSDLCLTCKAREDQERDYSFVVARLTRAQRVRLAELLAEISAIKAAARTQSIADDHDGDEVSAIQTASGEVVLVDPSRPLYEPRADAPSTTTVVEEDDFEEEL